MQSIAMFGEPSWHAAVHGDAAVAVRIALRVAAGRPSPLTIDLVGSALLLCAVEGNAAAQVALQYLRRRFGSSTAINQRKTATAGGMYRGCVISASSPLPDVHGIGGPSGGDAS